MFDFFFKAPAWQLIIQADFMTKIILFSLFCLSIICIAIVAFKYLTLKKEKKNLNLLLEKLNKTNNFSDLINTGKQFHNSLAGEYLIKNLNELKNLLDESQKLNENKIEQLELISDQNIDKIMLKAEIYLPILGTSASVSPFVGLFGTVWGLIHSFVSISQEKSADIAVVAPGIAEALTTTLAGLIVAIPAMIAFHYFSNELRKMEHQMEHLADNFMAIVKQTFSK